MKGENKMKKKRQLFLAIVLGISIFNATAYADTFKGERILNNMIMDAGGCKLPEFRIAMTHSKQEWKDIYEAGEMEAEINKICPNMKQLPKIENPDYKKDVFDYLEYYSSDGGSLPKC